jgi:glycosyltransferase involved in cell wall biosynthesis
MSNNPKISVVMTVFNGERFIGRAIDSILNQTMKDFEFIIVDNASTDRTKEIVSAYSDSRIIFIKNTTNLGQTKALNIGIKISKGEFIARMDADDISLPERLQIQYTHMMKNDSLAVLGSWFLEIDEKGKTIRKFTLPTNPLEIKCFLLGSSNLSYQCVPHPIVLMRKKALFEVGLYSEDYLAQDYDLWVRLSRRHPIANLDKVLFKYRIYQDSQSHNFPKEFFKDCTKIIMNNIKYYWPGLKEEDHLCLMRMLTFLPQNSSLEGQKALLLFEDFFNRALLQYRQYSKIKRIKDRMKMYYLPRLFLTNKVLSIKIALRVIISQPWILLNKKLYAKIFKKSRAE